MILWLHGGAADIPALAPCHVGQRHRLAGLHRGIVCPNPATETPLIQIRLLIEDHAANSVAVRQKTPLPSRSDARR